MRQIKKGATDQSTIIRIVDSGDGTPETGVTSATAGLDLEYRREGATSVDLTESDLAAVDSAHSDGGMKHIGNGYYRVDLPDAAVATGANGVLVHGTATGMVVIGAYHHLVDFDPQDGVRMGLTALPNVAAGGNGGLPLGDASARVDVGKVLGTAQTAGDLAALLATLAAYVDTEVAAIKAKTDNLPAAPAATGDCITAAGVRSAVGLGSANLDTQIALLATAANLATVAGYIDTEVSAILAAVDTEIAAIKAKTDNLPAAPAATGDIPTAAANAAALLAATAEGSLTVVQLLRLVLAACANKLSGAGTTTVSIRDLADGKNRIVATVDASGNRSAVSVDGT